MEEKDATELHCYHSTEQGLVVQVGKEIPCVNCQERTQDELLITALSTLSVMVGL